MLLNDIGVFNFKGYTIAMANACTEPNGKFVVGLHPLVIADGGVPNIDFIIPYWLGSFEWDEPISFNRNKVEISGTPPMEIAVKYSERVMELIKARRSLIPV